MQAREQAEGQHPAQVEQLYSLAADWFGSRLPHADEVLQEEMREARCAFSAAITGAAAFVDSRTPGMVVLLERSTRSTTRELQARRDAQVPARPHGRSALHVCVCSALHVCALAPVHVCVCACVCCSPDGPPPH